MKALFQVILLLVFLSCKAQEDTSTIAKIDNVKITIERLEEKNDSLAKMVNELKAGNNSAIEVIDKVDNLYNNNFNRFIIFWGIVASIIVIGIPLYIAKMQKKMLEIKKAEILNFSTIEITKLEIKLSEELTQKYNELTSLVRNSNQNNKDDFHKEFVKSSIVSIYIASKINEIDKNYKMLFKNLLDAINKSNEIGYFTGVNFHLKNVLTTYTKLKGANAELDFDKIKNIAENLKSLRDIEEIDQELLEKVISELG